ncbi:MAG: FKBP-type peptidyl-prolyl cis-trans isomerase, partial [Mesorhizobium sp.]
MTQAKNGDTVRINYTGRLVDGTQFDSSGNEPLQFTLGEGQVIPGLETHVEGMEVGTKSTVTVPADAAYGPHRPEAVVTVDRAAVPANINIDVGTRLQARTREGRPM